VLYNTSRERLTGVKHSSLLGTSVSYEENKVWHRPSGAKRLVNDVKRGYLSLKIEKIPFQDLFKILLTNMKF
jgi:hypothetical protein